MVNTQSFILLQQTRSDCVHFAQVQVSQNGTVTWPKLHVIVPIIYFLILSSEGIFGKLLQDLSHPLHKCLKKISGVLWSMCHGHGSTFTHDL